MASNKQINIIRNIFFCSALQICVCGRARVCVGVRVCLHFISLCQIVYTNMYNIYHTCEIPHTHTPDVYRAIHALELPGTCARFQACPKQTKSCIRKKL